MASPTKPILILLSTVLGLVVLITSSFLLDEILDSHTWKTLCRDDPFQKFCTSFTFMLSSASVGTIAGSLQILLCSFILIKLHQGTKWPSLRIPVLFIHLTLLLITLAAFVLVVRYDNSNYGKTGLFKAMIGLDWVFCLVVLIPIVLVKFGHAEPSE